MPGSGTSGSLVSDSLTPPDKRLIEVGVFIGTSLQRELRLGPGPERIAIVPLILARDAFKDSSQSIGVPHREVSTGWSEYLTEDPNIAGHNRYPSRHGFHHRIAESLPKGRHSKNIELWKQSVDFVATQTACKDDAVSYV